MQLYFGKSNFMVSHLPEGPEEDNYAVYLSVRIIDNDNGMTTVNLPQPVYVLPNSNKSDSLLQALVTKDPIDPFLQDLNAQSLLSSAVNIMSLGAALNKMNNSNVNI
jgi:hypothetical protein